MTLNEYQELARQTAIYPQELRVIYPTLGLTGEAGEVAEKVKKTIRDRQADFQQEDTRRALAKELGDTLWYLASVAADLGLTLEEVAQMNVEKILSRQQRNMLHGTGDER